MPAASGKIGELIEYTQTTPIPVPNNDPLAQIAYLDLPPGDWDVSGNVIFVPDQSDLYLTEWHVATGLLSGNNVGPSNRGGTNAFHPMYGMPGHALVIPLGQQRYVTTAATTRVYLQAKATFTANKTMKATGYIRANRAVEVVAP